MKFMLTFSMQPDAKKREEAIARFKEIGAKPPPGVKLVGRWTAADFARGFALLDATESKALTEFAFMWSDLMELQVVPVLEDGELGEVLQRVGR